MTEDTRTSPTATAELPWGQPTHFDGTPPLPDSMPQAPHYGPPPPPAAPPEPEPKGGSGWQRRLGAAAVAFLLCLGSGVAGAQLALRDQPDAAPAAAAEPAQGKSQPSQPLAKVAAAVQPSIVSITINGFGGAGSGSGVILRSDGTILTNNHVVEGAARGGTITVTFADGKKAQADLVGRDPATDLAVIKARDVSGLKAVTLGSADDLKVGDTVLAVGSPLGLEGSVSAGIVSALHRPVNVGTTTLSDAIQTDAPINPGNSGGGLFDTNARLVGINTAIATLGGVGGQAGNIGVGFAIPVDAAKRVADQLIRGEQPKHALLGVQIADARPSGALLEVVTPGGAADKAGLRTGDVITKFGDRNIGDATDLSGAVRSHQPGEKVAVTYVRGGGTRSAAVTLGSAG